MFFSKDDFSKGLPSSLTRGVKEASVENGPGSFTGARSNIRPQNVKGTEKVSLGRISGSV